ncbi:hypothetical protein [Maribacter cobaltidurans]|uniref:Uncharacterized protein n=1 Tax=Maribacter cobaltidurans TaxID=1178778 RepID=A0A223V7W0_9FLAO|nr:hypothetical protein [Maribacter cobaltidurans]ASV31392.1 hypothetical protein CJ263_14855 [Maribacter cobaltidurans]GGD82655.1 hypothetical protein GCM10011412_20530 [Maribacter cobaltidurans]
MLISNQRKFHLSFCRICINRRLSLEKGIVCDLNNQAPDFENNYPTYELDKKELANLKNRYDKEIQEQYPKSGLKGVLSELEFKRVPKVLFKKFANPERTYEFEIKKDNNKDKSLIVILWIVILVLVWGNFKNDFPWDLSSMNVVAMLVIFIGSFYFVYKGYFHKYPTLIRINQKGIDNCGDFIYWTDIMDYGIVNGKGDRSSDKEVLIVTISSGLKKINVSELNITQLQFIEILQHHKNNYS